MFNAKLEAEQVMGLTKAEMENKISNTAKQQDEVERTDMEWFARIPLSILRGTKDRRISHKVFNLISDINWLNVVYEKAVFWNALENLPTRTRGVCT